MTCPQEKTSQSEYSPGIVDNSEIILRLIFSPLQWDEKNNELKPAAFNRSELKGRGSSVERKKYTNLEFLRNKSQNIGKTASSKKFMGVVSCLCDSVRKIRDDNNQQAFCVLDTATIDDRGHADLLFSSKYQNSKQLKLREKLMDSFYPPLVPIEQLYPKKTIYFFIDLIVNYLLSILDCIRNFTKAPFLI